VYGCDIPNTLTPVLALLASLLLATGEARADDAAACPADICVGPYFDIKLPSEAAARAREGDTIGIQAGDYEDCARWHHSVTIFGIGGRPRIGNRVCGRKAVWIVQGDDTLIRNVELHGGSSSGRNGEGIRHEGKRLVVRDSVFHDNRMGILTNHGDDIELELFNNEFYGMRSRSGLAHQVYAGQIGRFVAEGNYLHESGVGHYLKSVAAQNRIRYNYLHNPSDTRAALIDLWGCSATEIVGNVLVYAGDAGALQAISITHRGQGERRLPCDSVPSAIIAYNTAVFTDPAPRWSSFVRNQFGVAYTVVNNLLVNMRDLESSNSQTGLGQLVGNVHELDTRFELFYGPERHDYRLRQPIGRAQVTDDAPDKMYVHPLGFSERHGAADVGAYEHTP
jgi:hypothetical protein